MRRTGKHRIDSSGQESGVTYSMSDSKVSIRGWMGRMPRPTLSTLSPRRWAEKYSPVVSLRRLFVVVHACHDRVELLAAPGE